MTLQGTKEGSGADFLTIQHVLWYLGVQFDGTPYNWNPSISLSLAAFNETNYDAGSFNELFRTQPDWSVVSDVSNINAARTWMIATFPNEPGVLAYLAYIAAAAAIPLKAYDDHTALTAAFPIFKQATVASGNIVVQLTDDGTSTGNALFTHGPNLKSLQAAAFDGTNPTFGTPVLSNSNKTLTIPVTKLSPVLGLLTLNQAATGSIINLTIWGN